MNIEQLDALRLGAKTFRTSEMGGAGCTAAFTKINFETFGLFGESNLNDGFRITE
jgi:hypothetical protein